MDKKSERMIDLHAKLVSGKIINKQAEARHYGVSEKSIQRDIEDLRDFFFKQYHTSDVVLEYDRSRKGYRLIHTGQEKRQDFEMKAESYEGRKSIQDK